MFAKHPEMAKEWADKTPSIKALPEHVKTHSIGSGMPTMLDSGPAIGLPKSAGIGPVALAGMSLGGKRR